MKNLTTFVLLCYALLSLLVVPSLATPVPQAGSSDYAGAKALDATFAAKVTLTNGGTSAGYGAFLDLVLEKDVTLQSAKYLGSDVATTTVSFTATGCQDHPLARDSSNNKLQVCHTKDSTLHTFQLPFALYAHTQPTSVIDLVLKLSGSAVVGASVPAYTRTGFYLGATPSADAGSGDPSILTTVNSNPTAWLDMGDVVPAEISLNVRHSGSSLIGPSYQRTVAADLVVPTGFTLKTPQFLYTLDNKVAYVANSVSGGTADKVPAVSGAPATPSADHVVRVPLSSPVTGATATTAFNLHILEFDASGNRILDELTGNPVNGNGLVSVTVSGTYDVLENVKTVNASGTFYNWETVTKVLSATSSVSIPVDDIVVSSSVSIATDTNTASYTPGDTVEYTITATSCDYFNYGDLVLRDTISDGQTFDATFTPTIQLSGAGAAQAVASTAHYPLTVNGDKSTLIPFAVSSVLSGQSLQAQGLLEPAKSVTIRYRATIDDAFSGTNSNRDLIHGDTVTESSSVIGGIRNNTDVTSTISASNTLVLGSDANSVKLVIGSATQSLYAVNGVVCDPCGATFIYPNDVLTFRMKYTLPSTDFTSLKYSFYLPGPLVIATDVTTFTPQSPTATTPAAGSAHYGPDDTFYAYKPPSSQVAPTVSSSAVTNVVSFAYNGFSDTSNQFRTMDLLFSVRVKTTKYPDQIALTVLGIVEESAAEIGQSSVSLMTIKVNQPIADVVTGAVATSNTGSSFSTSVTPGSLTWSAPGTASCPRFNSGSVTITDGTASSLKANVNNADAGDIITLVTVVENTGTGYAYDIVTAGSWSASTSFSKPTAGYKTCVTDGAGNALTHSLSETATGVGVTLTGTTQGTVVQPVANLKDGKNLVVITYDVELSQLVTGDEVITGTSALTKYAGFTSGDNHITETTQDQSTVTITKPVIAVAITSSHTTNQYDNSLFDVRRGETVEYTITVTLPEGTNALTVTHQLPKTPFPLTVTSSKVASIGGNIYNNIMAVNAAGTASDTNADSKNDLVTFNLGTSVGNTADGTVNSDDQITLIVTATVDLESVASGYLLPATSTWTYGSGNVQASVTAELIDPVLTVSHTRDINSIDAGDTVTYTVVIEHDTGAPSRSDAHSITLDVSLPSDIALTVGSVGVSGTGVGASIVTGNGVGHTAVQVTITSLALSTAQQTTVEYKGVIQNTITPKDTPSTTATVTYHTLPSSGGKQFSTSDSVSVEAKTPSLSYSLVTGLTDTGTGSGNSFHVAGAEDIAIGEEVTFTTEITVIEGTDTLKVTIGSQSGSAVRLPIKSWTATSLPNTITGVAIDSSTITGTHSDQLVLDFGTITNPPNNIVDSNDKIIITVVAQASADAENKDDATLLTSQAHLEYDSYTRNKIRRRYAEIVEPSLTFSLTSDKSTIDANDEIEYTLTVSHATSSRAPAYNLVITSAAVTHLVLSATTVTTTAGTVTTGNTLGDTTVRVDVTAFKLGDADIVVKFKSTVGTTAVSGSTITVTCDGAYRSSPSPETVKRDYSGSAQRTVSVAQPVRSVTVKSSTLSDTELAAWTGSVDDLAIGESVTFEIQATLAHGTTNSFEIVMVLPSTTAGQLSVTSAKVTHVGSQISGSALSLNDNGAITDAVTLHSYLDTATFTFGTVVNTPDAVVDDKDRFKMEVVAKVEDSSQNTNGDQLDTVTTFDWQVSSAAITTKVDIVEPVLNIVKTVDKNSGDALDTHKYTLVVSHDGVSKAHGYMVQVDDSLTAAMDLVVGSVTAVARVGGVDTDVSGQVTKGNTVGDTVVQFKHSDLTWSVSQTQQLTITYQVKLKADVTARQSIINSAALEWYSLPAAAAGSRKSTDSSATTIVVNSPSLTMTSSNTDTSVTESGSSQYNGGNLDLVIGEEITFRFEITTVEGQDDVTLVVSMPKTTTGKLLAVSGQVDSVGGSLPASLSTTGNPSISDTNADTIADQVTFAFGSFTNTADNVVSTGDVIKVSVVARVLDITENTGGDVLVTSAVLSSSNGGSSTKSLNVDLIEPVLQLTATPSTGSGDSGDSITYTVAIAHTGGSAAPAFTLSTTAAMTTNIALTVGSVSPNVGGSVITGNTGGDASVRIDTATFDRGATALSASFQGVLTQLVNPSSTAPNPVGLSFQSCPSSCTVKRTYTPLTSTATVAIRSNTVTKIRSSANASPVVGEEVTYRVTLRFYEGTSASSTLVDTLPSGLALKSVSSLTPSGSLSTSHTGGFPAVLTDVAVTNNGQTVTFPFDTVLNSAVNDVAQTVVIEYVVIVLNVGSNVKGSSLVNSARLAWSTGSATQAAPALTVTQPELTFSTLASTTLLNPTEDIVYTVSISHAGGSNAGTHDVEFKLTLPSDTDYKTNSLTAVTGPTPTLGGGPTIPGATVVYTITYPSIALGSSVQFKFTLTVKSTAGFGVTMDPSYLLTYTTLSGDVSSAQSVHNTASTERSLTKSGNGPSARVNHPPNVVNDAITLDEDTSKSVDVTANDNDNDGNYDKTSVSIVSGPSHGSTSVHPTTGVVTYTPTANYNGNDVATYQVCDTTGVNSCKQGSISIIISQVFDPVTANNDAATLAEDGNVLVDVTANDVDADNDVDSSAAGVSVISGPSHGTAVVQADGKILYTPAANYNGGDSFGYRVHDTNKFSSDTATVTITVSAENDAPVVTVPSSPRAIVEDTLTPISGISAGDVDSAGSPVKMTVTATQGTITLATKTGLSFTTGDGTADPSIVAEGTITAVSTSLGSLRYQGNLHYVGNDTITINVDDQGNSGNGGAKSDTQAITVIVSQVNDPIVCNNDTATTTEDTALVINVLANDVDPESAIDATSVQIVKAPSYGTASVNPVSGAITYAPNQDFNGQDSFDYSAKDVPGTVDTAGVVVTVTPVNDAPVVIVPSATVAEDTLSALTLTVNDVDSAAGELVFDLRCATLGATLQVTSQAGVILVNGTLDLSGTITSDSECSLSFKSNLAVAKAVLATLKYKSKLHFVGTDSVSLDVDDQGNSGAGTPLQASDSGVITVTQVNDAIVAVNDAFTVSEDIAFSCNVIANDIDIEGDVDLSSIEVSTAPTHGTAVADTTTGRIVYTSATNYVGTDTFKYKVKDTPGTSSEATVTITVNPVNDFPVITATQNRVLFQDTTSSLAGFGLSDVDIGSGYYTIAVSPTLGTVSFPTRTGMNFTTGDGVSDRSVKFDQVASQAHTAVPQMTYRPPAGFTGADSITVSVTDNGFTGSGGARNTTFVIKFTVVTRPRVVSLMANDPDDLDAILSNGDTLTLTFSEPTNQPTADTKAAIDALMSISVSLGNSYTGTWLSNSTLQITVVDSGTQRVPVSAVNVTLVGGTITNAAGTAPAIPGPVQAAGDWGLLAGPSVGRLTADDPDDLDSVYGNDDTLTILFGEDTNQPPVSTKEQIDALMTFSSPLGYLYSGAWLSARSLRITIVEYRNPGTRRLRTEQVFVPPAISTFFITMKAGITNKAGTSLPSVIASPKIDGDWGLGTRFLPCPVSAVPSIDNTSVLITFQAPTTRPNPSRKIDIDNLVEITPGLVGDYSGVWVSDTALNITLKTSTIVEQLDVKPKGTSTCPSLLNPQDGAAIVSGGGSVLDNAALPDEECSDLLPVAPLVCAVIFVICWAIAFGMRVRRPRAHTLWKHMLPFIRRQQERKQFTTAGVDFFGDRTMVEDLELTVPTFWQFLLSPEISRKDLDRVDKRELVFDPDFKEETRPIMNMFEGQHVKVHMLSRVAMFLQVFFFVLCVMFLWLCYWLAALVLCLCYILTAIGTYAYYSMHWVHAWEVDEEGRDARRKRSGTSMSTSYDGTIPAIPSLLPAVVYGDHAANEVVAAPPSPGPAFASSKWDAVRRAAHLPAAMPVTSADPRLLGVLKNKSLVDHGYDPDETVSYGHYDTSNARAASPPRRGLPTFPTTRALGQRVVPTVPPPVNRRGLPALKTNLPSYASARPPSSQPPPPAASGPPSILPPLRPIGSSNEFNINAELENRREAVAHRRFANNESMSNLLAQSGGHGAIVAAPPTPVRPMSSGSRNSLPPPPVARTPSAQHHALPPPPGSSPLTEGQIRAKAKILLNQKHSQDAVFDAEKEMQREKMLAKLQEKRRNQSPQI